MAASIYYQILDAGHDANGNPRRITLKYDKAGKVTGKHIDRYDGNGVPRGAATLADLKVSAAEYRRLKKLPVQEF